jgi:uncharacterized DUF497 family protein
MSLGFEWDERKALANLQKHGVGFVEASSVFKDPLARIFADEGHSLDEPREIIVGYSLRSRLLLVNFTERGKARIRIIGARRATRREQIDYEENIPS